MSSANSFADDSTSAGKSFIYRHLYPLKGTSFDCVYVCLNFLLFVKNGFVGAFAECNSDPLKQIRPSAVALAELLL